YRFRHALLREAVYDDMRPVDRIAGHRRVAEALTARRDLEEPASGVAVAELAQHWLAARDEPQAFAALVAAARQARAACAWAEARWAYEEAIALWDRVPDPAASGARKSELLERAAQVTWWIGDGRDALRLGRLAQVEPDVIADPARLGRL